jgi:hypothetical protein
MMTAVEIHGIWERYAEERLVAALNHSPDHFLQSNIVSGVTTIPKGLANYLVRSGGKYFDFRSVSDLIEKGDRFVGKSDNPFRTMRDNDRKHLDALAAIRNCVVHQSEAARSKYKSTLASVYGIRTAPDPDEFLNALDMRQSSPARRQKRVVGLSVVVKYCVQHA